MQQTNSLIDTIVRHWKLAATVAAALVILLILSRFALVTVTVTGSADEAVLALYNDGQQTAELRKGLNIVSKGDYTLRASAEGKLTEKYVQLKPFTMNRVEIDLAAQRSIQKVASKSLGCVSAKGDLTSAGEVFSYNCESINSIVSYSFVARPTTVPLFRNILYVSSPYGDGVIGLGAGIEGTDDELRLVYVRGKSVSKLNYLGNPLLDTTKYHVLVPTDENGRDKESFVVADGNEGKLTLFENTSDNQPSTVSIEMDGDLYWFAANRNSVYVLSVDIDERAARNTDNIGDDPDDLSGGTLKKYAIENGSLKETARIEVPDTVDLYGMKVIDDEILANRDIGGVVNIYRIENGNIVPYDQIEQTDDIALHRNGLAYRRNKDYFVYSLDGKQSRLVYRLDRLSPTYIQNSNGQLVLSVLVPNTREQYSFVVTDNERADGLERILNYPQENISVRSIDYNDTTIFVEFALTSFFSDHATGRSGYDPAELSEKIGALETRLLIDGIDPSKFKIIHQ